MLQITKKPVQPFLLLCSITSETLCSSPICVYICPSILWIALWKVLFPLCSSCDTLQKSPQTTEKWFCILLCFTSVCKEQTSSLLCHRLLCAEWVALYNAMWTLPTTMSDCQVLVTEKSYAFFTWEQSFDVKGRQPQDLKSCWQLHRLYTHKCIQTVV